MQISLNHDWLYQPQFCDALTQPDCDTTAMQLVNLPHTCVEMPFNYFDESMYQMVTGYRKTFFAKKEWQTMRTFVTFEGVGHIAKVYCNGIFMGEHLGGYTAFTFELTDALHYGEDNILAVSVDSRESNNIPPFGNVIDYMTYGGIYREVSLTVKPPVFVEDVFVSTRHILRPEKTLRVQTALCSPCKDASLRYALKKHGEQDAQWQVLGTQKMKQDEIVFECTVPNIDVWELDAPHLYWLSVSLCQGDTVLDTKEIRFGFRECKFENNGFLLNRKRVKIVGLNRHQAYPYVGYAMPKRAQQFDADVLKNELGVNAVRTSHYPQSRHFIDRCDEIGLLVFTEIVGWQHIGDDAWQAVAIQHTKEMVQQYRNHPSIILWGVRINESQDCDPFYEKTNACAHALDNTRQTGGVRFLPKSNLLEDVYTYNDFSHTGNNAGVQPKKRVTSDVNRPYLISEFNGHMFPTKAFDDERRRLEHATRHARVLDGIFGYSDITGGFGWCMADYNTHKDFGSGDRICYHGVLSMFRTPKLAASVYASQQDKTPVLAISSDMNIGEHPAGNIGTVLAFTNADSVRLYKNDQFVKAFFPDKASFPHLPHAPMKIDDFVGCLIEKESYSAKNKERIKDVLRAIATYGQNNLPLRYKIKMGIAMLQEHLTLADGMRLYYEYVGNWGGEATQYRFDAVKGGACIASVQKQCVTSAQLQVQTDATSLCDGDTYDVASVRISVVDAFGQVLPYYQGVLSLDVQGALVGIGPTHVCAIGGSTGTYVKTIGKEGTGTLTVRANGMEPVTITFRVRKENSYE